MAIRAAIEADYPAFVELFAALETGDDTPVRATWEAELMPNTLVKDAGTGAIGYVYFQVLDALGYIRHLSVDAAQRKRGIGRALMTSVAQRVRDAGAQTWCLNVKPDNAPAIALYVKLGMRIQYATDVVRMHWDITERLPAADAQTTALQPEDDSAVESALGLPAGLLGNQRGRGCHMLAADRGGTVVGLAAFRPAFPGAYPFRATDVGATRSLLDAMARHRDPTKAYVQVVLEDAAAIRDALLEAGGWRHLEIVHLRGAVPVA